MLIQDDISGLLYRVTTRAVGIVDYLENKIQRMASELDVGTSFIPSLYKPPPLLPIARHKKSLLYLVETFPVTIVVGHTGSGKTTQLPQYLDQAGWCAEGKTIAVTQVRLSSAKCLFIC